jgi:hypothetical protein
MFVCPICAENSENHSFDRLDNNAEVAIFYSCPGKALKYKDHEGIVAHFDGMLRELDGKPWKWMIDGTGFRSKHAVQIQVAMGITQLIISNYSTSLQQIMIINASGYIHSMIAVIWPFLTEYLRSIIVIQNNTI